MRLLILCAAAALIAGCAGGTFDHANIPEDQKKLFSRTDCRRITGNPQLQAEFDRVKTVCLHRAEAAAAAGSAPIINSYGRGVAGGIAEGIQQGMTERRIGEATIFSCMAEHGYLWRTRSEQDDVCRKLKR
jgi:hypothetical protein